VDKSQTIAKLFDSLKDRFTAWASNNPTGEFKVSIPVHQGGFREPYEVGVVERERV
jgi:hypothetical protein